MSLMADSRGLQDTVTTNVKVLMAVHGIRQTELADRLGWDRTVMSNRLSGKRGWKIEDVEDLATYFRVSAGALLGDPAGLIGATGPTRTAVNASGIHGYFTGKPHPVTALAQVIDLSTRRKGVAPTDAPIEAMMSHVG